MVKASILQLRCEFYLGNVHAARHRVHGLFLIHLKKERLTCSRVSRKNLLNYVIRRFNFSSARLISPRGWTFAETPFSAISRSNRSPESAEVRPLFKAPREGGSWFKRELDCSSLSSTIHPQQKIRKYDNSTPKKIKWPVAFAARFTACPANLDYTRFPSHPARPRLLCAFAHSASGSPSAGRRLCRRQHG